MGDAQALAAAIRHLSETKNRGNFLKEYQHKEERDGQVVEIKAIWDKEEVVEAQAEEKDIEVRYGLLK